MQVHIKKNNKKLLKTKKQKSSRTVLLSKLAVCGGKKLKFLKEEEAKGILSSLGFITSLNKIPLLGKILFQQSLSV